MRRLIMFVVAATMLAGGAIAKGPTKEQVAEFDRGKALIAANDIPGALTVFNALCGQKMESACQTVKLINDELAKQDNALAQTKAQFTTALDQFKAKDYANAEAGFDTLCKQQLDAACQNQAAVLLEEAQNLLGAAKRPNGETCAESKLASDYCKPAMEQAIQILSKICPTQSKVEGVIGACQRSDQLKSFVAKFDPAAAAAQ